MRFAPTIPVDRSSWIAARAFNAAGEDRSETSPVYVVVEKKPVTITAYGDYWMQYCDFFWNRIDSANFFLSTHQDEIRDYILGARSVFEALAAYGKPFPPGVRSYGYSTYACKGPLGIVALGPPVQGQDLHLACFNAPPNSAGFLMVGALPDYEGTFSEGATLFVDTSAGFALIPVVSNSAGHCEFRGQVSQGQTGAKVYVQFLWDNTAECTGPTISSATEALELEIQ